MGVRKGLSGRRLSHSPWAMLEGLFLTLWHSRWLYHLPLLAQVCQAFCAEWDKPSSPLQGVWDSF